MLLLWPYVALALVLLWTPLIRCLGRARRRRLLQAELTHRIPISALLQVGWNWLDLVRAGVGAWVLVHLAVLPPLDPKENPVFALLARAVVIAIGVGIQSIGNSNKFERLTAPVVYLIGITVVLVPWQGAAFGGILALVMADMLRGWIHLFWLMPLALAVALRLFGQLGLPEILLAATWVLPAVFRVLVRHYQCLWVLARIRTDGDGEERIPEVGGRTTENGQPTTEGGRRTAALRGQPRVDGPQPSAVSPRPSVGCSPSSAPREPLPPDAVRRLHVRDGDQSTAPLDDDGKRPMRRGARWTRADK